MSDAVPLLRAPPFPWVAPQVAAVSRTAPGEGGVPDAQRLDELIAAIRAARVGGAFWAPPHPPVAPDAIVIRFRDPAERDALEQRALRLDPDAPTLSCPHDAAIDPWSLLVPGRRLIAAEEDEWVWLAALAGAEAIDMAAERLREGLGARLLGAVVYRDCFHDRGTTAEDVVAILADWRRQIDANRPIAAATGIAWWKKPAIEHFLWAPRATPLLITDDAAAAIAAAGPGETIATWPSRAPEGLAEAAAQKGVPVASIEDGFIRSVGLGAALHPPQSIVVDRAGIYYDPGQPSDLETVLATADFPPSLLARAEALRRAIVASGISKYGSDPRAGQAHAPTRSGLRTVLVAGQVEDDMSVRRAGGDVAGNLDLLRRARAAEPDARILFRPHPDVDAGHRVGKVADAELRAFADAIVRRESMAALLAQVDAVHVLTSLTGFEALLRGIETIVHGQPFYAGWGLTTDLAPDLSGAVARRTRRLTRAQLIAGTLILYPRYLDPATNLPCPPEILLKRFAAQRRPKRTPLILARRLQGRMARLLGRSTD